MTTRFPTEAATVSTPPRYRQLPLFPTSAPERPDPLAAARAALAAADQATRRGEARQATARLTEDLAHLARARGRTPIPKPTHRRATRHS